MQREKWVCCLCYSLYAQLREKKEKQRKLFQVAPGTMVRCKPPEQPQSDFVTFDVSLALGCMYRTSGAPAGLPMGSNADGCVVIYLH